MPEQSNQFDRESITPEEMERIRLERERVQREASDFSDLQQKLAESRGMPKTTETLQEKPVPVFTQPDIPGITREHVPLDVNGKSTLTSVEDLNAAISGLQKRYDGTHEFNPSGDTEEIAKVMDQIPDKES